ncbi:MAG TPA: hypothetical protein ENI73_08760 [Spirochaetes bacterium]|nr:hypothetical protein [Spirochaetota bacterium]
MADDKEEMTLLQKILENNWLLLAIGLVVPGLIFSVWGTIELLTLKSIDYKTLFAKLFGG